MSSRIEDRHDARRVLKSHGDVSFRSCSCRPSGTNDVFDFKLHCYKRTRRRDVLSECLLGRVFTLAHAVGLLQHETIDAPAARLRRHARGRILRPEHHARAGT